MAKEFAPNFKTPEEDFCKEEKNKLGANYAEGSLFEDFRDEDKPDVAWESEQIAKSHGIYLEFDRAKTGREKDWSYMIRITIPGGGPLNREQWQILDDLATQYTSGPRSKPSIRFTTRQNIQYHWVEKENLIPMIQGIASSGYFTLNGCGDNTRNVMACPLSKYSTLFNANAWARKAADYFELPRSAHIKVFAIDPEYLRSDDEDKSKKKFQYGKGLLNRKFKIAFSTLQRLEDGSVVPDNCVELLTNDLGVAPVWDGKAVSGYQVFIGGGQGERNGKPSMATLAKPLALVSDEDKLLEVMDAVVAVHQEWGDRQNRHWARLKYVVKAQGIEWYRERMAERLGYQLEKPIDDLDVGPRELHHGWQTLESNGKLAYGAFIENGRITDESPNGKLQTMMRKAMDTFDIEAYITPNQDVLFTGLESKAEFSNLLASHGFGTRNGKAYSTLRMHSGACVGRDTCRLTYTDSEKFEPELIDQLEEMGWGDLKESIGITGCERQCFRPSTKSIGLVGTGLNRYQLRLMGSEDARNQGQQLLSEDKSVSYLRSIPREEVATVIDALFKNYQENRQNGESLGYFHQRVGLQNVINFLKNNPNTSELMENTTKIKALIE